MDHSSEVNHLTQPCIYGLSASSNTEKKSRFMKWLSKIFKGNGSGGSSRSSSTGGRHPQFLEDENMVWRAPSRSSDDRSKADKGQEESDRALALSLSDGSKRSGGSIFPFDHQFPSKSFHPSFTLLTLNGLYLHYQAINGARTMMKIQGDYKIACIDPPIPPTCPLILIILLLIQSHFTQEDIDYAVDAIMKLGMAIILDAWGLFSIQNAFVAALAFSLSGKDPYHKTCFKELTHPKCEIPTNAAGLIEYRCHPFWSQKYCPSHEHDHTARCCSCERLESWNTRYIALGDGRSICLECMESAIMDTGDCQPLYHAIRDYYEGMNMRIDQQIPMLLVERQALNEAISWEKNGFHHMPETRGLCLSEEQTVTSILRRPRIGGHKLVGMRTQPQKLTRRCEVTAILVLYGYRNLSPDVEEGICQVLSYMWLESEVTPGFQNMASTSTASTSSSYSSSKKGRTSEVEKKLGEFFLHQIANDASPAYGGGFRSANAAVNKYGLRRTLDHIRFTGSFPI
ncbi:Protein DA1-related 2 [Bienertia sinuspersici]